MQFSWQRTGLIPEKVIRIRWMNRQTVRSVPHGTSDHVISLSPDEAINGILVDLASVRYCSHSSNPKLVGIGNGKERRTVVDRSRLTIVQHRYVFPGHCLKSKRPRPGTLQSACSFCSSIFEATRARESRLTWYSRNGNLSQIINYE